MMSHPALEWEGGVNNGGNKQTVTVEGASQWKVQDCQSFTRSQVVSQGGITKLLPPRGLSLHWNLTEVQHLNSNMNNQVKKTKKISSLLKTYYIIKAALRRQHIVMSLLSITSRSG